MTHPAGQTEPTQPDRRVVVGVDGSPCSVKALRWAIVQAQRTGAGVEAVASWQDPVVSGYFSYGFAPVFTDDQDWAALTGKYLQESVAGAVDELHPDRQVVARVVQGHPAQVLLDASHVFLSHDPNSSRSASSRRAAEVRSSAHGVRRGTGSRARSTRIAPGLTVNVHRHVDAAIHRET